MGRMQYKKVECALRAVWQAELIIFLSTILLFASCTQHAAPQGNQPTPPASSAQYNAGTGGAAVADDGQWLIATKDYANTRFSGLNEITTQNVNQLKLAWTFSTGSLRGEEAAPLVVGSTMYVVTPFPNYLYALDLSQPGAPTKWMY